MTLFPEELRQALSFGVIGQALRDGKWSLETVNPRDFTTDNHRTVDDRVFGGGDGMLMLAEPLSQAVQKAKSENPKPHVVHLSPRGRKFTDTLAKDWSRELESRPLVLVSTRYAGVDQRFIDLECDDEVSIGDFVLSGGELPAAVIIDCVLRQRPGVLGNDASAEHDSFSNGLFESAQYTRPREWRGKSVPAALLSGDPKIIADWRYLESCLKTIQQRPDLILDMIGNLEVSLTEIEKKIARFAKMKTTVKPAVKTQDIHSEAFRELESLLEKVRAAFKPLKASDSRGDRR